MFVYLSITSKFMTLYSRSICLLDWFELNLDLRLEEHLGTFSPNQILWVCLIYCFKFFLFFELTTAKVYIFFIAVLCLFACLLWMQFIFFTQRLIHKEFHSWSSWCRNNTFFIPNRANGQLYSIFRWFISKYMFCCQQAPLTIPDNSGLQFIHHFVCDMVKKKEGKREGEWEKGRGSFWFISHNNSQTNILTIRVASQKLCGCKLQTI